MVVKDMKDFKGLKLDEVASVCIFVVQTGCEPSLSLLLSLSLSLSLASVHELASVQERVSERVNEREQERERERERLPTRGRPWPLFKIVQMGA